MNSNSVILKLFVMGVIPILTFSCSQGSKQAATSFTLRATNLVDSSSLQGATFLKVVRLDDVAILPTIEDLDSAKIINLTFGTYDLYLVSYTGPGTYEGTPFCGFYSSIVLSEEEQNVTISVNENSCLSEPFLGIIQNKINSTAGKFGETPLEEAQFGF